MKSETELKGYHKLAALGKQMDQDLLREHFKHSPGSYIKLNEFRDYLDFNMITRTTGAQMSVSDLRFLATLRNPIYISSRAGVEGRVIINVEFVGK